MRFSAHIVGVLIFCLYPGVGRLAESTRIIYGTQLSAETDRTMSTYQDFGAYLRNFCTKYGNKIFRVNAKTEKSVSWQNVLDKSHRIAKFLLDSGCSAGSVIGVYCEDSFEYPAILLAVMNIGATYTSVDIRLKQDDVINNFNLSRPSVVFTSSNALPVINEIKRAVSSIRLIVDIDQIEFPEYGAQHFNYVERNKTDTAMISYTSGTTGAPKAVKQSHETWIFQMELYRTERVIPFPPDNVASALLPPGRTFELITILVSFVCGHKYIMVDDYERALFYVQKYGINTFWTNPFSASFLVGSIPSGVTDLKSVQLVLVGGDFLQPGNRTILKDRYDCQVFYLYGQTETAGFSLVSSSPETHGHLMPGMKAKIVDLRTGTDLGPFEKGEFCIQGPLVSSGYEGSTAARALDADGWLHSGDFAQYDEKSNFYILDRLKTLMNCKSGLKVSPIELEMVLLEHPDVEEVAVVPVPSADGFKSPRAFIVKKPGSSVSADDIQQYMKGKLPPEKSLSGGVVFKDYLPKKNDKISRQDVQKWVTEKY